MISYNNISQQGAQHARKNIKLDPGFTQVCVWPYTTLKTEDVSEFGKFFNDEMDVRVQFLECINTTPARNEIGSTVSGTGGRTDLFMAVHDDDVDKFAIPRLQLGIRWIEDVYSNGGSHLYPLRVAAYKSWDTKVK